MANNPYVNKVQKSDGTLIIDISDTTAVPSDVANGKYFYTADGAKVQGVASGGGSYVTQDADGRVILPPTVGTATTTTKTITQGGVYNASDDNVTGYSQVTVNVAGVTIGTKTAYSSSRTISFTGLAAEPKAFFVNPRDSVYAPSSSTYYMSVATSVRYNGTDTCACKVQGAYAQSWTPITFTYANGTLQFDTDNSTNVFNGYYKLTYIY